MKVPPYCPNVECRYHFPKNPKHSAKPWFWKIGTRVSQTNPVPIQRYKCKGCGRQFSESTFSVNYYSKKVINLKKLMDCLVSGMSVRAMGRFFGCSPNTINRKLGVLARQSAVLLQYVHEHLRLNEDLAADGFESFAVSQYFPNNFNFLVGKDSQYVYHFNYVQLHRKGRMTEYQKKKAAELRKKWPIRKNNELIGFMEIEQKIMELAMNNPELEHLTVFTDEKREYRQCLMYREPVKRYDGSSFNLCQKRINSKKHRDLRNELFPVNYIEREIRKDLAEHHRETTCFARNVNSSVVRMMVYLLYHNFIKPYRLNKCRQKSGSHAEAAGIPGEIYRDKIAHIFQKRFFISHYELRGNNEMTWCRAYQTPLKTLTDYSPAYALAG